MSRTSLSSKLSPDQLTQLAEIHIARAARMEGAAAQSTDVCRSADKSCGDEIARAARMEGAERLRVLTFAEALTNLAEMKKLLLEYERRLLN